MVSPLRTCPTLDGQSFAATEDRERELDKASQEVDGASSGETEPGDNRHSVYLCDEDEAREELGPLESLPLPPQQEAESLPRSLQSEPALPTELQDLASPFQQLPAWANGSLHGRRLPQGTSSIGPDCTSRRTASVLPPEQPLDTAGTTGLASGPGPSTAARSTRSGPGALCAAATRTGPIAGGVKASGICSGNSAVSTPARDSGGDGAAPSGGIVCLTSSSCVPGIAAPHTGGTLAAEGSHGAWVDTFTLWNSVQRHGEEIQRRKKLEEPARTSCVGASFKATWPRRLVQRARTQLIVAARVAAKDPLTVIVPVLLLVGMLAFGLWGVFSVAYTIRDGRRQAAYNAAVDFSNTLKSHIAATVAPASTAATLVKLQPQWDQISGTFYDVAPDLVVKGRETDAILTIVLAPQGIVGAIVPPNLPGWGKVLGLDLLREPAWRNDALKTVTLHDDGMVMTGPSRLRAGMMGIVTRYAVFIPDAAPDDSFGFNGSAYNCSPCYIPANGSEPSKRFWGFAQLNVDWEVLIRNVTHMYDLCERDSLHFNMTYIDPVNGTNRSIASCGRLEPQPMFVTITTMQNTWVLAVSDARGWLPDWLPLVLAIVVLLALWISITMAIILINRREHMWLLQAMLPKKVIATLRRGEEYAEAFECVTVLFSDIVSYTTLASEMEPIKVVRLLNETYSAFDSLVDQFECYKVETIGDAFMAVCGTQGEDAIAAAVKMAHLAQAMVERTRVLVSADGQKIQIRIGLHSGPVVGAVVGFKMPHFCLCGDTVNTASRMESNSRPMRIHISDATARLLSASGQSFVIEPRGPIEVKGKGIMVTHWLLPDAASATAALTTAADKTAAHATNDLGSPPLSPQLPQAELAGSDEATGIFLPKASASSKRPQFVVDGGALRVETESVFVQHNSAPNGVAPVAGVAAASGAGSRELRRADTAAQPPTPTAATSCPLGTKGLDSGSQFYSTITGSASSVRAMSGHADGTVTHNFQSRGLPQGGIALPIVLGGQRRTSELLASGDHSNTSRSGKVSAVPLLGRQPGTAHTGSGAINAGNGGGGGGSGAVGNSSSPSKVFHSHSVPGLDQIVGGAGAGGGFAVMPPALSGTPPVSMSCGGTRKSKSTSVDLRLFQLGSPARRKSGARLHG